MMNSKAIVASSVILFLLLGILGLQLGKENHIETPSVSITERYPFKNVSWEEIDSFSIQSDGITSTLKKIKLETSHYFGLVEKKNYPADGLLVHHFLQSLLETVLIRKVSANEKFLQDCGLEKSSATKKIVLKKSDGSVLTQFTLGKEASTGGHFFLFEGKSWIYLSEQPLRLPKKIHIWEDLRFPQILSDSIRAIKFSFPREEKTQNSIRLERTSEEAPLKFAGEGLERENTYYLIHFLTQLEVSELLPLTAEETGLKTPVQVTEFQLLGDAVVTVSLGNVLPWAKDDQKRKRYVAIDFKISQESPEALKTIYYDWKKRSGNHIFLLNESQDFHLLNFQVPILSRLERLKELRFTQKENSVHFEKKENQWIVKNGYDFPANEERLSNLISELQMIKSRPGDLSNPEINPSLYEDSTDGNILFNLTFEDGQHNTLTQGKRRQGVEVQTPEYKRIFSIDDVSNVSDEWGNYYIKPSGALTLGSRGVNELNVSPQYWLYRTLAEFPETDIAEIQWKSPHQTLIWTTNATGKLELLEPKTLDVSAENLLQWLKEVNASDLVRSDDVERLKSFETAPERLLLSTRNKKGLQLTLQFKNIDVHGNVYGTAKATYVPPVVPPTQLALAQKEYEALQVETQKTEKSLQETSTSLEEALKQSSLLQEQVQLLTQQIAGQNATLETLSQEDESTKEAREILQKEIEGLTLQKKSSEEKLIDLFNATQALQKKSEEQKSSLTHLQKVRSEKEKELDSLQKEALTQQEELEEEQKEQERNAQETQKLVTDINTTFGTRLLIFNAESAFSLFLLKESSPNYDSSFLQSIILQKGDRLLTLSHTPEGWKTGEHFASLEKIEALLSSLEKLELRKEYHTPPVETPEILLTLNGREQKNVYKLGPPFTVKNETETTRYRQIQWNENTYLIKEEALSVDVSPENWQDLRLVRLNLSDIQAISVEYPETKRTHHFLVKDGKLTFSDLAPDYVMSELGLEESLAHLLDHLKLDLFLDKPTDSQVVLNNKLLLKHATGEVHILFSNLSETEDRIWLQLQISGTPDAEKLKPILEKKWLPIERSLLEDFLLPRETLVSLRVYVSHILVSWKGCERSKSTRTKEEALERIKEVEEKLKGANANFAELAGEYSDEPGAKQTGGVLPFPLQKDTEEYDPVFRDSAIQLQSVGAMSPIIETKFGFHILKRDQ